MQNQPGPPQYPQPWQPPPPSREISNSTIVILVLIGVVLVGCGGACGLTFLINRTGSSLPVAHSSAPAGLLPEIQTFLDLHKEFGSAVSFQDVPDWAQGKRQRVTLETTGNQRSLLFYVKGPQVVTIYEDGVEGRKKVWGEFSVDSEAQPKKRK